MNRRLKHVAALLAGISLSSAALAQSPQPSAISVSGEATMSVAPDTASLDAGVTTDAKTAREASEANNKAMGLVLLALKSATIADKDVQTARLSLQPQSSTPISGGPSRITGYRAGNRVTVTIRDLTQLSTLIDALTAAGANEIGGIDFRVSQASRLLDDVRAQALADARRKAEIYARAADVTLGSPLAIAEDSAPSPAPFRKMSAGLAAATPIAQGEETLRVGVTVSYEIKPKAP